MFKQKLQQELNPAQIEAVCAIDTPVLVLSGAGTGKTRVITYKMAYLVAEAGLSPQKILSMTFTNKAAREMVQRAETLLGDVVERSGTIPRHWIGTFHANCARMLRTHARLLHYTPNFTITDMDDRLKIIKELIALHGYRHLDKTGRVKEEISHAKNNFLDAEDLARMAAAKGDPAYLELSELYRAYNSYLLKNNTMDFDDLIVNMVKLLYLDEEVRSFWQQRFDYIMVDEFQDTNKSQYLLLKMLMRPGGVNLTMVGDDDQSIYSFRGATIENILALKDDFPELKMIKVVQNYRSAPAILDIANTVIANNQNRLGKDLEPTLPADEILPIFHQCEDNQAEAKLVALKIVEHLSEHPEWNAAVIYRMNAQSRSFEHAFLDLRLPYALLGSKSFYDRREVKDIIAYFRLLSNSKDDIAFKRIINVPTRGIGQVTLKKLEDLAQKADSSLFEVLEGLDEKSLSLKGKVLDSLKEFHLLITELRELIPQEPQRILRLLLESTDFIKYLEHYGEEEERRENIAELSRYYDSYFAEEAEASFERFLEQLSLLDHSEEYGERTDIPQIFLTTVHGCKGLEFDCVFVVGLAEEFFPHYLSVDTQEQLEEERRLFYVAVTRAKERLFLSTPKKIYKYGVPQFYSRSRFVDEIPDHLITREGQSRLADLKNLKVFFE